MEGCKLHLRNTVLLIKLYDPFLPSLENASFVYVTSFRFHIEFIQTLELSTDPRAGVNRFFHARNFVSLADGASQKLE